MRELTQQEIDNAPDWATHYAMDDDGEIFWQRKLVSGCHSSEKPIPRKPFDIGWYEFSDKDIFNHFITKDKSRVNFDFDSELMPSDTIGFNKQDAIALAKHFKLI